MYSPAFCTQLEHAPQGALLFATASGASIQACTPGRVHGNAKTREIIAYTTQRMHHGNQMEPAEPASCTQPEYAPLYRYAPKVACMRMQRLERWKIVIYDT